MLQSNINGCPMESMGFEAVNSLLVTTVIGLLGLCLIAFAGFVIADVLRERREQRDRCPRTGRPGLMAQVSLRA